jgi:hypothetical protein
VLGRVAGESARRIDSTSKFDVCRYLRWPAARNGNSFIVSTTLRLARGACPWRQHRLAENCCGAPVAEHGGGWRPRVHIRAIPTRHDQDSAGTHTIEAKSKQAMPNLRLLIRPLSRLADHHEP